MRPQLRTLTLILISYASFHFLLNNLTPPVALAQPNPPRPPSVLDKIPLEKWGAAVDKLYGKVEDWRPVGIESVRMVRITTTTTGGPTKATTTTTTTTKPTTTTAKPTTTTSKPTTTTTTTSKPTGPFKPIETTDVHNFADAVIREIQRRSNFPSNDLEGIINRVGKDGIKTTPIPHWGKNSYTPVVPHQYVQKPPEFTTGKEQDGHYVIILLDYNGQKCYYLTTVVTQSGAQRSSAYTAPKQGSKNIFMFLTFSTPYGEESKRPVPKQYPFEDFDLFNFINAENLTLADATAFKIT